MHVFRNSQYFLLPGSHSLLQLFPWKCSHFKNCCIDVWHSVFEPLYHLFQIRAITLFVCLASGRLKETSVIAFTMSPFLDMWINFHVTLLSLFTTCLSLLCKAGLNSFWDSGWVDDLRDDIECTFVIPPGHWTKGSAHWIIWVTRHALDHSVVKKAFLPSNGWPFGGDNYTFSPQAVRWVVLACPDRTYVNHWISSVLILVD